MPEGFDQLEGQRAGAQHAGPTIGAQRVVHLARLVDEEHAAVGEREVDLLIVCLPLVGDRLDADAWKSERDAVVPRPHVHRFPHVGVVGLVREDELPRLAQAAGQIDTHVASRARPARSPDSS